MRTNRRQFMAQCGTTVASVVTRTACHNLERPRSMTEHLARLFFTSQGRTAVIHADGSGIHYFDFQVADQETWQPGPFLSDGRRVIFLSMEARRDGPGRPFDKFYQHTPTHLWLYDLERDELTEICRLDPNDGSVRRLTQSDPPVWDFRASQSPSGRQILFCRAKTGDAPGLYVIGANETFPRLLIRGLDGQGADHPRWLPTVESV